MRFKILISMLLAMMLIGCNKVTNPFKDRRHEYIKVADCQVLVVDKKLMPKTKSDQYAIPNGVANTEIVESLTYPPEM